MERITLDSKVKEVYAHPIGRDIIRRLLLQMNISPRLVDNPVTGSIRLKTLKRLTGRQLGSGFFDTLTELLNHETDVPLQDDGQIKEAWWKEAVFYQIYPRSFCDGNGDGMGDLKGITGKLDYLLELGVDAVWLSPVYDSPNDDNGYDIRDYRKIWEGFGSMEDWEQMVSEIHKRGMRLIMDLVVNHTSDEHEWFQTALKEKDSPYREYYFFQTGEKDTPPNNWTSFFSGSAWRYYEEGKEWALHLFSSKQMDLNWENPALRADIIEMIRWWLTKGVDGFRMDVINYISKTEGLPEGDEKIGALMGYYGIEHYFYGPRLHEYLKEIKREAFAPFQAFSVGETPGIGMEMGKLMTGDDRGELDMIFSFDHLETPGHVRFDDYLYDLNYLKSYYIDWMENYGSHCWMSLFFENHDNPRMISKVEKDTSLHPSLAKLLLAMQLTLKGTPFIYQGQEMGLANIEFKSIEGMSDVESINLYGELTERMDKEEAFRIVLSGSRDHARAMMDWEVMEAQAQEEASVTGFSRSLISLRKENRALIYGDIEFIHKKKKNILTYFRTQKENRWYMECSLSREEVKRPYLKERRERILSNYEAGDSNEVGHDGNGAAFPVMMKPYEVTIYRVLL